MRVKRPQAKCTDPEGHGPALHCCILGECERRESDACVHVEQFAEVTEHSLFVWSRARELGPATAVDGEFDRVTERTPANPSIVCDRKGDDGSHSVSVRATQRCQYRDGTAWISQPDPVQPHDDRRLVGPTSSPCQDDLRGGIIGDLPNGMDHHRQPGVAVRFIEAGRERRRQLHGHCGHRVRSSERVALSCSRKS